MQKPTETSVNYDLHLGDNLITLKTYPDEYFDSIVSDPPYGIAFLGKDWDQHTGTLELYKECLRVLKPGGYMLAFSAARTYHQLASNIELAGFEIRDQLMWLYSSGFPKAQDIGKAIQKRLGGETSPLAQQWEGFKTALKPAHEPIVMARKPYKGSTIDNVLKNGLGAMNIDATRVPWADEAEAPIPFQRSAEWATGGPTFQGMKKDDGRRIRNEAPTEMMPSPGVTKTKSDVPKEKMNQLLDEMLELTDKLPVMYDPTELSGRYPSNVIGEVSEQYQKYFYCPKVSRKERHIGFDVLPETSGINNVNFDAMTNLARTITRSDVGNNHPTVKPVALMDYLIKLVTPPSTPELQRRVLDPYMGSGSTGMAAVKLGHHFTGCDLDENYINISKIRIDAWNEPDEPELPPHLFG